MQLFKSFNKFSKFNSTIRITRFYNIFSWVQTKLVVFAIILVPCVLQFPLIASGQDGVNIVNSRLGIVKVNRKHVESREIAVEITMLTGENRFEFMNVWVQEGRLIPSDSKNVIDPLGEPTSNNSSDKEGDDTIKPSFFHRQFVDPFHYEPMDSILYWIMMMFPTVIAIVHPIVFGSRDNVKDNMLKKQTKFG